MFGFYVLSGYLMTMILHETYGYSASGFVRYALNRWLRIFPVYYVALGVSLVLVLVLGDEVSRTFHKSIGVPQGAGDILRNAALFLSFDTETRLVAPAWALTIECVFYVLIGLGASRFYWGTIAWLGLSVAYSTYLFLGDAPWSYRYFTVAAASLPFSLGAAVYHVRKRHFRMAMSDRSKNGMLAVVVGGICVNYALSAALELTELMGIPFYINLVLMALLIANLASHRDAVLVDGSVDKRIGDMSYPVYLLHYQAGLIVWLATPLERGDLRLFFASSVVVVLLAYVANRIVENPINRIRNKLRPAGHVL